jgi:hypothetical protein
VLSLKPWIRIAHCQVSVTQHIPLLLPAGNSSYIARKASANYRTAVARENAFGWYPGACGTAYNYLCEMPETVWPCPATPPAPPAREPGGCEWLWILTSFPLDSWHC